VLKENFQNNTNKTGSIRQKDLQTRQSMAPNLEKVYERHHLGQNQQRQTPAKATADPI
jgi:hypothetical protein